MDCRDLKVETMLIRIRRELLGKDYEEGIVKGERKRRADEESLKKGEDEKGMKRKVRTGEIMRMGGKKG